MIPYILHSAILLAACLVFYKLLIEKETYFRLNRGILLLFMGAILMLPLVSIPAHWSFAYQSPELPHEISSPQVPVPVSPSPIPIELPPIDAGPAIAPTIPSPAPIVSVETVNPHPHLFEMAGESHFSWTRLLQFLYGAGVAVFGLSLIAQFASLGLAMLKAPKRKEGKYTFVELPGNQSPFSFGNYIFLGKDLQDKEEVLAHERIHVDQGHTLDIILAELLFVFQWFNPFAWIFKKTVKQNLEFLTDQEMLSQGFDPKSYQISLVNVSAPNHTYSITANYNQSLLKKRILMMHAKRSSIQSGWKYLALFPMLALSTSFLNAVYLPPEVDVAEEIGVPSEPAIPDIKEEVSQRFTENPPVVEPPILPTLEQEAPKRENVELFLTHLSNKGTWKGRIKEREFCITLIQGEEKQYNYIHNECYGLNKFPSIKALGTSNVALHEFSLEKEEGTIFFEGSFNQGTGEGSWVFESSSAYRDKLESMGIAGIGEEFMFRLFLRDDNSKYIENAKELQGLGLSSELLEDFITHLAPADLAKEYQDAGLDLEETHDFLYSRVKASDLVEYREAGLSWAEHEEYIHSRVNPNLLKKYIAAGLNLDDHEGYIHGRVDPEFLKKYMTAGLDLDEHEEYIHSRVDPDFLKKYRDSGLDLDEHEEYIHSRVDPDFLKKYMDSGLNLDDHEGYIHSRVDPDFLKKYMDSGLDLDDHEGYIHSRVDPDFLEKIYGGWPGPGRP